jgi:hypothetical protein
VHSDHWGNQIFLPSSQAEASICVADATTEGQPTETVKEEEEKEQTLMFSPAEGEEHSTELLKIFSQEVEQEMTAALSLQQKRKQTTWILLICMKNWKP